MTQFHRPKHLFDPHVQAKLIAVSWQKCKTYEKYVKRNVERNSPQVENIDSCPEVGLEEAAYTEASTPAMQI